MPRKPVKEELTQLPINERPLYSDPDAEWGGFINIRLSDEEKQAYRAWRETSPEEVWIILESLLGAGAKIGLSYDMENETHICTLQGRLMHVNESRFVVTTRAGTWGEAIALTCWKHAYLARGNYDDFKPRSGKFGSEI